MDRIQVITQVLQVALAPTVLEIEDQGHLHIGHAGARDGRGHFAVKVVSDKFEGLTLLQRHRAIYDALGDLMQTDIHALTINAVSQKESI